MVCGHFTAKYDVPLAALFLVALGERVDTVHEIEERAHFHGDEDRGQADHALK